jgi:MFS family permease
VGETPPAQFDTGRGKRSVLLLYLLAGLATAGHGSTELINPLNLNRLGLSLSLVGATVAVMSIGSLASRLPAGAWYRLSRARVLLAAAFASMGLSTLGLALTEMWELIAALGAIHGFAFGLTTTLLLALLIEVRPRDDNPAPAMAWYTAAAALGYAIGSPLAAQVIERFGHSAAFWASGGIGLLGSVLALALQPSPEREVRAAAGSGAEQSGALRRGWRSLAALPSAVWLAALTGFYVNFLSDSYNTFFPIYAVTVGISLGAVGFLRAIHSLCAMSIRFVVLATAGFLPVALVVHLAVVGIGLATIALSIITELALLAAIFGLLGLFRGMIGFAAATLVAEERNRPNGRVGLASGVYNAGLDIGNLAGPPVAGALATSFDIPTSFRLVAGTLLIVYYTVWLATRKARRRVIAY